VSNDVLISIIISAATVVITYVYAACVTRACSHQPPARLEPDLQPWRTETRTETRTENHILVGDLKDDQIDLKTLEAVRDAAQEAIKTRLAKAVHGEAPRPTRKG